MDEKQQKILNITLAFGDILEKQKLPITEGIQIPLALLGGLGRQLLAMGLPIGDIENLLQGCIKEVIRGIRTSNEENK